MIKLCKTIEEYQKIIGTSKYCSLVDLTTKYQNFQIITTYKLDGTFLIEFPDGDDTNKYKDK